MRDVLYLAWRYLVFHRWKTVILVTSITLIAYLPVGLNVIVGQSAEELTARAEATPLIVGVKGSPLELVLSSLYFDADPPAANEYGSGTAMAESDLATPIPSARPLHRPRYADRRHLSRVLRLPTSDAGRGAPDGGLGECVLGAGAARDLGVGVGDAVISSPESVFDLAGVYPLKMSVVGVLEPAFTPDDSAIFVDVKTAWVIQGLGHGHQDSGRAGGRRGCAGA